MGKPNVEIINNNNQINVILNNIKNDLKNIDDLLKNNYNAVKTLTDQKWNTKEKRKMESELMPYLEIMSKNYYNFMNERFFVLQNAIQMHLDDDVSLAKEVEEK